MTPVTIIDIWINCPSKTVADKITDVLLQQRLVACANTYTPIDSVYRWQGVIERQSEIPLLLKSRADLFDKISATVDTLHPYATPAIIAIPISMVNDKYRDWVIQETAAVD